MPETPRVPRRIRQPSPRHRRLTPRDDLADRTGKRVHAVIQESPDDRLNEEKLKIISDALNGMQFKSKNPSFEDYSKQSPRERGDSTGAIEQENSEWINTAFSAVADICWIQVENGRVTAAGGHNTMPDDIDIYEEGRQKGYVPFVFCQDIEAPLG